MSFKQVDQHTVIPILRQRSYYSVFPLAWVTISFWCYSRPIDGLSCYYSCPQDSYSFVRWRLQSWFEQIFYPALKPNRQFQRSTIIGLTIQQFNKAEDQNQHRIVLVDKGLICVAWTSRRCFEVLVIDIVCRIVKILGSCLTVFLQQLIKCFPGIAF